MRLFAGAVVAVAALFSVAAGLAAKITRHATTAGYSMTLNVGPVEQMYTPAQVKAKHPTSGEVMVGGGMMMDPGMSMGGKVRHLEVHISSLATGKVVTTPLPTISLTDTASTMTMSPTKVEVVAMEGVGQGVADYHFGNNVALIPKHTYNVVVVEKGQRAAFTFVAS